MGSVPQRAAYPRVVRYPGLADMAIIQGSVCPGSRMMPRLVVIRLPVRVIFSKGSYWVPGWWEEVWVASLQGLYDSRRRRREPTTGREDLRIWRHRIWSTSWH